MQIEDLAGDAGGYELRFYPPSIKASEEKNKDIGLYDVQLPDPDNPVIGAMAVWSVIDPGPGTNGEKRLRAQERREDGAVQKNHDYPLDDVSQTWSLDEGEGLRRESRTSGQLVGNQRVERTTVSDSTGAVVSVVDKTYQQFAWGEEVVKEVRDPDGAALTTITGYYTDANDPGNVGHVYYRVEPDSGWVRYYYYYYHHRRVLI